MKITKLFITIVMSFSLFNVADSGLEGMGEIKLNNTVLKYYKGYLGTKGHGGEDGGSSQHGRGWFFFIAESGEEFGYTYCEQGFDCVMDPLPAKKFCQKNVKKYLKRSEKCYLFSKQRTIVWDGKRIKIPRKASSEEIDEILKRHNWID